MRWFQSTYTARFNRRHRLAGHLFQGRYKAVVVDADDGGYFAILSDYIHLNPIRARLIRLDERLSEFPWSSYRWYVAKAGRAAWFTPEWVLGELGLGDDAAGRRTYGERMRRRAVEELSEPSASPALAELRRGWCLGGPSFRERMLVLLDAAGEKLKGGRALDGAARRDHGEAEASRLLALGLRTLSLEPEQLPELAKGDPRKVALAVLLRERTIASNEWISRQLHLGHLSRVSRCWRNGGAEDCWQRKLRKVLGR